MPLVLLSLLALLDDPKLAPVNTSTLRWSRRGADRHPGGEGDLKTAVPS